MVNWQAERKDNKRDMFKKERVTRKERKERKGKGRGDTDRGNKRKVYKYK